MTATTSPDARSSVGDASVRLRVSVYDDLVRAKYGEKKSPTEMAAIHGISRAHMYRLRSGDRENPTLALAMRVAADLGVAVEELWEQR